MMLPATPCSSTATPAFFAREILALLEPADIRNPGGGDGISMRVLERLWEVAKTSRGAGMAGG
jgi:hypothetical protein